MSIAGPMYGLVAALLTRMSTLPKRSTVAATQASACVGVTGVGGEASATSPSMPAAASSRASCLRDESITFAPDAARVAAMARPMPFEAPVTSATRPSRSICMRANVAVAAR